MADNSTTNHPSLPSDYVSINVLRDRWLKKQQQKEENRIEATKRNKGKEKVQEVTTNHPSLPSNYVTILDLRERWLKQQQQQQQQQKEENDRIEMTPRDKGKEKAQEVTVACQIDGKEDKNSLQFRNPNPNLIPGREFRKNTQEKAQVTEYCQVDGKEDRNNPQFRNPNPNSVRGRGFRRNSNWSNRRPMHREFHGGEKITTQNQAVEGSNSSQEASETIDGVEIEAEDGGQLMDAPLMSRAEKRRIWLKNKAVKGSCFSLEASEISDGAEIEVESVNDGGELKDAPLMSKPQKKRLKKRIRKQKLEESKNIAKKGGEEEEAIKLNVSKVGGIGKKTGEIQTKMKEINVSKSWEINVSKIGGIEEKTRRTEWKMKEINVSKIGEKTREIESKMKEMTVTEECSPDKAKKEVVMAEKTIPAWKGVREVRWGDRRAEADRRVEVYGRGTRGFNYGRNEPRGFNYCQVKRRDKCGLMWVKKADGVEKLNNGCVVEDGDD